MFASPIRPRTMTKEWQEATEEYMKVRNSVAANAASHYDPYVNTPTGPRNRAHHRLQGNDGSEQVREGPAQGREDQRRVKSSIKGATTHEYQYRYLIFLGSISAWYCLCHIYDKIGGLRAAAWPATVILVLRVQKSRGIHAFCFTIPASTLCRQAQCTLTQL